MTHIEELKAKVAELQATIEAMEEETKPKKFEWKYKSMRTFTLTHTGVSVDQLCSGKLLLEHGRYRLTKEVAEQSLARNKRANRLEALAEQLGGLGGTFYVFLIESKNEWKKNHNDGYFRPEVVYMTEECAIEICRMLNSGEFSLEGEL